MIPSKVGFDAGAPGHELSYEGNPQAYTWGETFVCTCGFKTAGQVLKSGKMSTWATRAWRSHINAVQCPDEIIGIGKIIKTRITWEIYVFSRTYPGSSDFAEGSNVHYKNWAVATPNDGWLFSSAWAVGIKKSNGKMEIVSVYASRYDAVERGMKILSKAANRGEKVEYSNETPMKAPVISPSLTLTEFISVVDEALESKKLREVQEVLEKLNLFLEALPVLEAKRAQLVTHHDKIMTMGREDLGYQQEKEGCDTGAPDGT